MYPPWAHRLFPLKWFAVSPNIRILWKDFCWMLCHISSSLVVKDLLWWQILETNVREWVSGHPGLDVLDLHIWLYWTTQTQMNESRSVVSDSLQQHGLYSPWNSPGQNTGVASLSLLQGSSQPRAPVLHADSLPAEPQGKPKNTGVGRLFLLQWIFPTQELNQVGLKSTKNLMVGNYPSLLMMSMLI